MNRAPSSHSRVRALALVLAAAAAVSCRSAAAPGSPQIVQPGAPGQTSRVVDAAAAADLSKVPFTPADVRFMQGMIGHHAQALDMTGLVPSHSGNDAIRKLAQRIELSQADEIKMMQDWLTRRGQQVPGPHAHHAPGAPLMPGMLTAEQMARLGEVKGPEFDRLFLESMIKHHEGALTMVQDLFAQPGAGQESDVFAFASDVDADQRMEIDRMRAALVPSKEPVR
jgi:uncharacterized protein (DUF305 family)